MGGQHPRDQGHVICFIRGRESHGVTGASAAFFTGDFQCQSMLEHHSSVYRDGFVYRRLKFSSVGVIYSKVNF